MVRLHIKDRGRDLAVHDLDHPDEAHEIKRVYELLGYASEKIEIELITLTVPEAA